MKKANLIKYVEGKIDFLKPSDFIDLFIEKDLEIKDDSFLELSKKVFKTIDGEILEDTIIVNKVSEIYPYEASLLFIINKKHKDIFVNKGSMEYTFFDDYDNKYNLVNTLEDYTIYNFKNIIKKVKDTIYEVELKKSAQLQEDILKKFKEFYKEDDSHIEYLRKRTKDDLIFNYFKNECLLEKDLILEIVGGNRNSKFSYFHCDDANHISFNLSLPLLYEKDKIIKMIEEDFEESYKNISSGIVDSYYQNYYYNTLLKDNSIIKDNKPLQLALAIKRALNKSGKTALLNGIFKVESKISGNRVSDFYLKKYNTYETFDLNEIQKIEFRNNILFDINEFNEDWEKNHKE